MIVAAMVVTLAVVYLAAREISGQVGKRKEGPVLVELGRKAFGQGDFVEMTIRVRPPGGGEAPQPLVRVVDGEGKEVTGVGGIKQVTVGYDETKGRWQGRWALPWGAEGSFAVVAQVKPKTEIGGAKRRPGKEVGVLEGKAAFKVTRPKMRENLGGLCITTLESLRDYRRLKMVGPGGKKGDWRVLFDWAEWMGANTFWYSAGWTGSWGELLTDQEPWVKSNLAQARMFGAEAHRRGMKYGVWILAYATHAAQGRRQELLPKYEYAWDYDPRTGKCQETSAISLRDSKRLADVVKLVKELGEDENVDMVGLDYIRTVKGGYEMADEFVSDMGTEGIPEGWDRMDRNQKMAWLGRQIEYVKEPSITDKWNWWRARQVKGIVEKIKQESGLRKPLWVFTLTWKHGMQHGQDPFMMTAAGADLDAAMLYESNRAQYNQLIKDWNAYVKRGELNIVVGEVVDWGLHQRTLTPAGPEEAYQRARTATKYILGERTEEPEVGRERKEKADETPEAEEPTVVQGVFWHDLDRLTAGDLGPYPSEEWALAGGRVFSEVKADWGTVPVRLKLEVPESAGRGEATAGRIEVTNQSKKPLEKVTVEVVKTPGVIVEAGAAKTIELLPPGDSQEVEFKWWAGGDLNSRGDRVMVAVVCTWEGKDRENRAITFEYVEIR